MIETFLGIDIGTTGTKAVLVRRDGKILGHHSSEYGVDTPHPGWAEQWPETWLNAVINSVQAVLHASGADPATVQVVGLSGQMHSTVLLDQAGEVLRPAIIWADQRSAVQVEKVNTEVGQENLANWTGNPLATGFMLATWLWLREHEPEIEARSAHLLLPKDYVRYWMTGEIGSEASDAASTSLFCPQQRTWSTDLLDAMDLPAHKLPLIAPSASVAGTITEQAASLLGLAVGTPVIHGGSDQAMQALGNGVLKPGTILATIGTGGQLFAPTANCVVDQHLRMHSFCHILPDVWHVETAILTAGLSLKWLRDSILKGRSYAEMADMAMQVPPGSEGLMFVPHLAGERTPYMDPLARGAFVGLTLRHGPAHIIRAVMEGVVMEMRQGLELMISLGVPADQVLISGGATEHPLWRQLQADMYGSAVTVTQAQHAAAVGAAMLGAYGVGANDLDALIQRWVPEGGEAVLPDPERNAVYDKQYQTFTGLYPALKATHHELNAKAG